MKRFLLLPVLVFFSCATEKVRDDRKPASRKIDPILRSIVAQNPNYKTNGVAREEAGEALQKALDSALNKDILSDMPMKIFSMAKASSGNGSIVYFTKESPWTEDTVTPSNMVSFDLIGLMSEEKSRQLDEKAVYYVHGHNYKQLEHAEIMRLVSLANHTPYVGVMTNLGGAYEFLLGNISAEVDSITLVPKPEQSEK